MQNVWLYTIRIPENVVVNCRNETIPFNVQLKGSGLFKIHSSCKAFTSQSVLEPRESSFSTVHVNYLPPLDLNFDICLNKSSIKNNTDFSIYVPALYNVHDYHHLYLASKSLKEVASYRSNRKRIVKFLNFFTLFFNVLYRVSTLKVEHRQLTLCIQFIDMPLFRYINLIKELNYNIKVIDSLSSFHYKFFEKITMQFLP
jgi:hypothetical protein